MVNRCVPQVLEPELDLKPRADVSSPEFLSLDVRMVERMFITLRPRWFDLTQLCCPLVPCSDHPRISARPPLRFRCDASLTGAWPT